MPGPESLRKKEYYGYSGNSFWPILTDLLEEGSLQTYKEKLGLLKQYQIALWDVVKSCIRQGAGDPHIRQITPNRIDAFIRQIPSISVIFLNGRLSERLYRTHFDEKIDLPAYYLPSTSPAYASLNYREKLKKWKIIKKYV